MKSPSVIGLLTMCDKLTMCDTAYIKRPSPDLPGDLQTFHLPVTAAVCEVPMETPLIRRFPTGWEAAWTNEWTSSMTLRHVLSAVMMSNPSLLYLAKNRGHI